MNLNYDEVQENLVDALLLLPPLHRMTLESVFGLSGEPVAGRLATTSVYLELDDGQTEQITADALRMLRNGTKHAIARSH